jgi:hypothetical protein
VEDIHDAHNWYQPYTTGTYGARQNLPEDLRVQFKAFLDEGVTKVDPAERHAIYQHLTNSTLMKRLVSLCFGYQSWL